MHKKDFFVEKQHIFGDCFVLLYKMTVFRIKSLSKKSQISC